MTKNLKLDYKITKFTDYSNKWSLKYKSEYEVKRLAIQQTPEFDVIITQLTNDPSKELQTDLFRFEFSCCSRNNYDTDLEFGLDYIHEIDNDVYDNGRSFSYIHHSVSDNNYYTPDCSESAKILRKLTQQYGKEFTEEIEAFAEQLLYRYMKTFIARLSWQSYHVCWHAPYYKPFCYAGITVSKPYDKQQTLANEILEQIRKR